MIFKNSQDDIEFSFTKSVKNIGIKLSGGLDSAIVLYMLAKFVTEERPDITIYPISCLADGKAFQQIFAKKVMDKITELTGVTYGTHYVTNIRADSAENYVGDMEAYVRDLYSKRCIQAHYVGVTANPGPNAAPALYDGKHALPINNREKSLVKKTQRDGVSAFRPLVNIDKKGVKELYKTLGVLNSIVPVTRSCEVFTNTFDYVCKDCWSCREKYWGFGHY